MDNTYKIECNNCKYHDNTISDSFHICKYCHNNSKFELHPNLGKAKKDEKPAATVNGATINYKNWGKESSSKCETCKHKKVVSIDFPCCKCFTGEMWESDEEEINSPSRYNKNGFECIEVMIAIFGKEAVRQFCKLNAFKYIWRESDKGKVNDIKKANYYLKKYVELSSESSDKC